ncbi:MAG: prolipoprotein diacylglyceryl transferase family protein, partial [Persicimonas sp.]
MRLDPSQLPSQSALIGVGILAAALAVYVGARVRRVDVREAFALFGVCAVFAVIGARLLWLAFDPLVSPRLLVENPMVVLDFRRGGYHSIGALLGAAAATALWWRFGGATRRRAMLDVLVPGGLAGLMFARLGCLFNGCDIGRPTASDWGVRYSREAAALSDGVEVGMVGSEQLWTVPLHPFALYLAVGTAVIVAGALYVSRRKEVADGYIGLWSAAAYFGLRFGAE